MREKHLQALLREATSGSRPPADLLKQLAAVHVRDPRDYPQDEGRLFSRISLTLLDRVGLLDRFAFARDIATQANTPKSVIDRLLGDDHLVATCVIELAPFGELELMKLIDTRDDPRVLCSIARRDGLDETVTDVLVSKGRPEVLTALAANASAKLSQSSLERLCDTAVRQSSLGKALARRTDLPPRVASMLDHRLEARHLVHATMSDGELLALVAADAGEDEEVAIAWRSPLSAAVTDRLIDRGRPRVMLTVAGNVGAAISRRGFDALSAVAADQTDMDEALARRSDLPVEIARNLYRRIGDRMRARIDELIARDLSRGRRPYVLRQLG